MNKDFFDAEALRYLLGEMTPEQRAAFGEQLNRYPAARIALEECADAMNMLRSQAIDLPFFGGFVEAEIGRLIQASRSSAKGHLQRGMLRLRQLVALS